MSIRNKGAHGEALDDDEGAADPQLEDAAVAAGQLRPCSVIGDSGQGGERLVELQGAERLACAEAVGVPPTGSVQTGGSRFGSVTIRGSASR